MPNFCLGAALGWSIGAYVEAFATAHRGEWAIFSSCNPGSADFTGAACVTPAVYALVGSAAVVCGVTRLTISLVTIMFELTGGVEYMIPIIVGVLSAKWAAELCGGRDAIYKQIIDMKGLEFLDPKLEVVQPADGPMAIRSIVTTTHDARLAALYEQQPLSDVVAALRRRGGLAEVGFPVLRSRDDPRVAGFVSRGRLAIALGDLRSRLEEDGAAAESDAPALLVDPAMLRTRWDADGADTAYVLHGYVDSSPVTVRDSIDVARVVHIFRRLGLSAVLVVDDANILQGWLTKSALTAHLQSMQIREQAPLHSLLDAVCGCPGGTVAVDDGARDLRDALLSQSSFTDGVLGMLPPLAEVVKSPLTGDAQRTRALARAAAFPLPSSEP